MQSKAVVATGFPDGFVMAFGYRLVSVGVLVGDTANMSNLRNHFYFFGTLSSIGLSVWMHLYANKLFFNLDPFANINSFHRIQMFPVHSARQMAAGIANSQC